MSFMSRLLSIISLQAIREKPQTIPLPSAEGLPAVSLPLFGGAGRKEPPPYRKPFGRRRKIHELRTDSARHGQVGELFDPGVSHKTVVLPFPRTSCQEKS